MRKYVHTLRSETLEKAIENYIDYVTNPYNMWRQDIAPLFNGELSINNDEGVKAMPLKVITDYKRKTTKATKEVMTLPKPRYEVAKSQIIAITTLLFRNYLNAYEKVDEEDNKKDYSWFTVPSKFLKMASNNYYYILSTLSKMNIISIKHNFDNKGNYSKTEYQILKEDEFHPQTKASIYKSAKKIINEIEEYEDEIHKKTLEKIIKATSEEFVKRYNASLAKLTLKKGINIEEIKQEIEREYSNEPNPKQKKAKILSRINTIDKLSASKAEYKKDLKSMDNNGRFYHLGTELQRNIKEYTNIKYSIDCSNSHPFLFTYILLLYIVKGNINIRYTFTDNSYHYILINVMYYLKENNGIYNHLLFSDYLRKNLENKRLTKSERAKIMQYLDGLEYIKEDVWQYVFDVIEGKLWDMFEDAFNEDRSTVKQEVFKSVIYSYYSKRKRKKKAEKDKTKWVEMFATLYPNVYITINEIKKYLHQQCRAEGLVVKLAKPSEHYVGNHKVTYTEKDGLLLSYLLMRLESMIFTSILTKLFNKRVTCFGIHDAVAVIHSRLSENEITDIMKKEFAEYGLIPTLKVEYYS